MGDKVRCVSLGEVVGLSRAGLVAPLPAPCRRGMLASTRGERLGDDWTLTLGPRLKSEVPVKPVSWRPNPWPWLGLGVRARSLEEA